MMSSGRRQAPSHAASPIWKASQAPRPALAPDPRAEIDAIACPKAGACVAAGTCSDARGNAFGVLLQESGGSWKAVKAPLPKGTRSPVTAYFYEVGCSAVGDCMAVGAYSDVLGGQINGNTLPLLETLHAGHWSFVHVKLPPDADFHVKGVLTAVSCPAMNSCTIVGSYAVSGQPQPFIVTRSSSTWSTMVAPTPGSTGGGPGPGDNFTLEDVTCFSLGRCAAVGSYNTDSGPMALFDLEAKGVWKSISVPQASQAYLMDVACPTATVCRAVGSLSSNNTSVGCGVSEVNGSLKGSPTPLPKNVLVKNVSDVELYSVACVSAVACTGAGAYYSPDGTAGVLLVSLIGTKWTSPPLPGRIANASGGLSEISCRSKATRVAVGQFQPNDGPHALLLTGLGKVWTANSVSGQSGVARADLLGVSCTASGSCTVVGSYPDRAGNSQPVEVNQASSAWNAAQSPLPAGVGAPQDITFGLVSCPSPGSCVAVGTNSFRAIIAATLSKGVWMSSVLPSPADSSPVANIDPFALSCPGVGMCVVTAQYVNAGGGLVAAILTERNGRWITTRAPYRLMLRPSSPIRCSREYLAPPRDIALLPATTLTAVATTARG
jgi:hypothetical protein